VIIARRMMRGPEVIDLLLSRHRRRRRPRLIDRIIQGRTEQSPADHVHDSVPAKPKVVVSRDLAIEHAVDVVVEGIVDVASGVLPRQEVGPSGAVLDDSLER
jgi:hypothetical protein